jgi:hypothetical protein
MFYIFFIIQSRTSVKSTELKPHGLITSADRHTYLHMAQPETHGKANKYVGQCPDTLIV